MVKVVDLSCDVAGGFASKLFAMAGLDVVRPASADSEPAGSLPARAQAARRPRAPRRRPRRGSWPTPTSSSPASTAVATTAPASAGAAPAARRVRRGHDEHVRRHRPVLGLAGWPARRLGGRRLPGHHRLAGPRAAHRPGAPLRLRRRLHRGHRGRGRAARASAHGRGRHVDLSIMESMLNVHQSTFSRLAAGIVRVRTGRYTEVYPLVVRPCRDGHVSLGVVTDAEFDRLLIAIGRDDLVADERLRGSGVAVGASRRARRRARRVPRRTRRRRRRRPSSRPIGVAAAEGGDRADVLANPQLAHRGFWDPVDGDPVCAPDAGEPRYRRATVPGIGTRRSGRRRASRLGPARAKACRSPGSSWSTSPRSGPGRARAGCLADLGARVIWVERPQSRREPDATADATEVVMHYFHLKMNRNKESVVLDLRDRPRAATSLADSPPRPMSSSRTSGPA